MLYKFISENEVKPFKDGFVVIHNRIYTNPTEEQKREAGYKELVYSEVSKYDEQTQYLQTKYKDGDVITAIYEVHEIEPIEEIEETLNN